MAATCRSAADNMEEDNEDLDDEDGEDDNDDAEDDNIEEEDNEEVEEEDEEEAGGREGGSQKRRSPAGAEERGARGGSAQPAAKKMRTSTEAGEGEGNVTKDAGDTSQGVDVLQQQTLQSLQVCMRVGLSVSVSVSVLMGLSPSMPRSHLLTVTHAPRRCKASSSCLRASRPAPCRP